MQRYIALFLVFIPVVLVAQEAVYVQVDYMKALPGKSGEYVAMEQDIYKAIHQQRIASGEILAWHLYEVRYPSGADAEYDYVTATIFGDFSSLDNDVTTYETLAQQAHPDMTLEEIEKAATSTRRLVNSEVFKSLNLLDNGDGAPANSLLVDYMKVLPSNEEDYLKMERLIWKPLHAARMDGGKIANWGLYELLFPSGLNHPYSHATVTGYKDWKNIADSWPDEVWKQVHPNASQNDLESRAHEVRDLVSSQIWKLIDSTAGN